MTSIHPLPAAAPLSPPDGFTLHAWYCPALVAYRGPEEVLPDYGQHLLRLPWVPLYAFNGAAEVHEAAVAEGWTLRSYYVPAEKAFYASHRTMSDKTAAQARLVELYAPPGAYGNDSAAHVPPKQK